MNNFTAIAPEAIGNNMIGLIGDRWMLVTAGTREHFNTMTASWGGVGFLWGKPVAFCFVRPNRYTYEFIERGSSFTLSFFGTDRKKTLSYLGSASGRNVDKIAESGLVPLATENGNVTFEEAELVLECRKLYAQDLNEQNFTDPSIPERWYGKEPLHKMYIAEIVKVWIKCG